MLRLNMTLDKTEITQILHTYVENFIANSSQITIDIAAKPKTGISANITILVEDSEENKTTVPHKALKPVLEPEQVKVEEPVKETKTTLDTLIEEPKEEELPVTGNASLNSIFSKVSNSI